MRSTYRVLAYLIAAAVFVQAATIAFAWFDVLTTVDAGEVFDENSEGNAGHALHFMIGTFLIPLLALVLLIFSFFAKVPGGVKWAAIIFGIVVLQYMLAALAFIVAPVIGALHGINALVLAIVASNAGRRAMTAPESLVEAPATTGV